MTSTSFDDYVLTRSGVLLRFAYVLCGDRHLAEDLVQEVLIKVHRRWHKVEAGNPDAYIKQALVRAHISWRRRRSSSEITGGLPSDGAIAGFDDVHASRDELWAMLAGLPRAQRAVLVLRYYEDLDDRRIAELVGVSPSTVRVHAHRGLHALRETLASRAQEAPTGAGLLRTVQTGAARATSRRRTVTAGGIAVIVAALVGGVIAFVPKDGAAPGPGPTGTPTTTPTATPDSMRVISVGSQRPPGPLDSALLTVADWGHAHCPVGSTQFTAGAWEGEEVAETFIPTAHVGQQIQADVTNDGIPDVVALLSCSAGTDPGGGSRQVAAYTRDGSGWRLVGKVTGGNVLDDPQDIQVEADGTVTVVNMIRNVDIFPVSLQTHHFRWTGASFSEQGSPTTVAWDERKADITVSVSPESLPGGTGDLRVTVRYDSGPELTAVRIGFSTSNTMTFTAPDGSSMPIDDNGQPFSSFGQYFTYATVEAPAVGASVTGTFRITTNRGNAPIYIGLTPIAPVGGVEMVTNTLLTVPTI